MSFPIPLANASLPLSSARPIWLHAQRLDTADPFGAGPEAVQAAVRQLGYVQIDTINVIERSHHHILFTRMPRYRRTDLATAQSVDKSVFEYWTHALAYVPSEDFRFFMRDMRRERESPKRWFSAVTPAEVRRVVLLIRRQGPLTIRDIEDDVLVEKEHLWASRKPSKRALQRAFFMGLLTVSARSGMLKTYELTGRHFGWAKLPPAASDRDVTEYRLDRALRSQGIISLDSACFQDAQQKTAMRALIERRVRRGELVTVALEDAGKAEHWTRPEALEPLEPAEDFVHILSPFDPLVIQRKRLKLFFGYEHRFEAYVPKEKRILGYFTLPVLVGADIVAALDLKTDRGAGKLLVQSWHWIGGSPRSHKRRIEEELHRFERFQLAAEENGAG